MTTTVTTLSNASLSSITYDALTSTIGLAAIGVLALLLLVRELIPVFREGDAGRATKALDVAVVPLFVTFAVVVLARLASLLR